MFVYNIKEKRKKHNFLQLIAYVARMFVFIIIGGEKKNGI